jgi:DNA-binding transcriptional LysR family regulator
MRQRNRYFQWILDMHTIHHENGCMEPPFISRQRPLAPPNFRTLDLNLLRVFDEVMSERNLTRAAANLSMTQPAVSNALRRLRDALHDELLVRAGYGVRPTPRALELWPAVRAALDGLRSAVEPGAGFEPARSRDTLVLAMADATAALLVPTLVRRLEAEAPGVSLRVRPLLTRDPRGLLASGDVDLAIGHFPGAVAAIGMAAIQDGTPDPVEYQRLYDGTYVCVMRAGHPLAESTLDLDRYCGARHLLVSFSGRPFGFVDEALAAIGRRRRVVLTVNQFFTAGQVVSRTDLLTVLPHRFVSSTGIASRLVTRPLPMELPIVHVDMLWHHRHGARPVHAWLRRAIADAARDAFAGDDGVCGVAADDEVASDVSASA